MKHTLLTAVLMLGSLNAASAMAEAPAQDTAPMQQRPMHHDPHKQAMHISKKLGLSPEEPILVQHRDQVQAIRQNTSLTPDQRVMQMRDLNRSTHQQLAGVLTPDQMQQWKSLHKEHHKQQQEQGAPAPTGM